MSNKAQNMFICSKCDAQYPKWSGRCLECGGWGTLTQQRVDNSAERETVSVAPAKIIDFSDVNAGALERLQIGIAEADRVFGGGIVPGSLILIGGEPGIGKSTLVAQIADRLGRSSDVLYVSGEESASQVKGRLERLKCNFEKIKFISETNVEKIISSARGAKPKLLIIDSIQTVSSSDVPGEAGGVAQIRASAVKFLELAKKEDIAIMLIGHITKDGQVAGPKTLEHIVDTVIYLEAETAHDFRIMRSAKNRFGSVNEIGVFEMTGEGLVEVTNPSMIFADSAEYGTEGSAMSCVMEGTRPFLISIQALVTKTVFGYPVRKASGFDLNRLQVLTAVLTKRARMNLANQDIILNIVGGLRISDPGLDLAVCASIASSFGTKVLDAKTIYLGEVGLAGEVRSVSRLEQRLTEAVRLGFTTAVVPAGFTKKIAGLNIVGVKNVGEIVK